MVVISRQQTLLKAKSNLCWSILDAEQTVNDDCVINS